MSLLLIAAVLYIAIAFGLILVVDNLVGLFFRETSAPTQIRYAIGKAFAASQKLYRK